MRTFLLMSSDMTCSHYCNFIVRVPVVEQMLAVLCLRAKVVELKLRTMYTTCTCTLKEVFCCILKAWEPFVMKLPETRRRLLCLYCTFKRASKLASEKAGSKQATQDELVWASIAAVPASIVRLIATKASLASDVDNSVAALPACP